MIRGEEFYGPEWKPTKSYYVVSVVQAGKLPTFRYRRDTRESATDLYELLVGDFPQALVKINHITEGFGAIFRIAYPTRKDGKRAASPDLRDES